MNGHFINLKSQPPITAERLARYQELRRRIGVEGPIFQGGGEIEVDLEVGSLSNGDSRKGFEYLYYPGTVAPLMPSLDHVRKPASMGRQVYSAYKPLGSGWYLFLMFS